MAFRWRVDSGPRLYADWDAFTKGMRFVLQRVPVFGLQRVRVLVYKGYAFQDKNNLST